MFLRHLTSTYGKEFLYGYIRFIYEEEIIDRPNFSFVPKL
jgi:hypothetical protein